MSERHDGWIFLIVQGLLLWLAASAAAQDAPRARVDSLAFQDGVIFSVGAGPATRELGGQISLWWNKGDHSLGVRGAASFDFNILSPSSSDADVAVLYGRRAGSGNSWGRIAAGPAYVETVRPGEATDCTFFLCSYEDRVARTVGLALQADGVWAFTRPLGIGISVFGNLNPEGTFFGAAVSLHVGNVGT